MIYRLKQVFSSKISSGSGKFSAFAGSLAITVLNTYIGRDILLEFLQFQQIYPSGKPLHCATMASSSSKVKNLFEILRFEGTQFDLWKVHKKRLTYWNFSLNAPKSETNLKK